jgi:HPt (histidine-containing phosphotransfer) domain-containing protein
MINKQQFNNFFQHFDKEMIIEVIDLFAEQSPDLIKVLTQNIEDHDLVQVKLNAHKLKGICLQLYDPVSSEHAKMMEDAAKRYIGEVIDSLLGEFPEIHSKLRQETNENTLYLEVIKAHTLKAFLTGLLGSLSAEDTFKLENTEKLIMAEHLPQMLADLTLSTDELLRELLMMKKELTS